MYYEDSEMFRNWGYSQKEHGCDTNLAKEVEQFNNPVDCSEFFGAACRIDQHMISNSFSVELIVSAPRNDV